MTTALRAPQPTPVATPSPASATTPVADGATRPYTAGDASAVRPQLGTPLSSAPTESSRPWTARQPLADAADSDNADAVDDDVVVRPTSERQVTPSRAAEDDDDRTAGELPAPTVDAAATTSTTSVPTRVADAHVEPADANETAEAPYAHPLSASELRRRGADDDD